MIFSEVKLSLHIPYSFSLFLSAYFNMEENSSKAMLSLLNIVLIVVPLISMIFTTIHYYNSYEFIELMLITTNEPDKHIAE